MMMSARPSARAAQVRERRRISLSTLPWQLTVDVMAAPSRAGLGTSTVGGAWNARIAGFELAFEALAARVLVHNSGQVAGGGTRGPWLWGDGRRNTDRVDGISNTVHPWATLGRSIVDVRPPIAFDIARQIGPIAFFLARLPFSSATRGAPSLR